MDGPTRAVYESSAARWRQERGAPAHDDRARSMATTAATRHPGRPVVDLGCGPGWHLPALGNRVVALDGARAMLDLVPAVAPSVPRLQADLARLPFAAGSLGGAWASRSYVHLARSAVPLALHDLHRALALDASVELVAFAGDLEHGPVTGDDFPGRRFSAWPRALLIDVVRGAGFVIDEVLYREAAPGEEQVTLRATRARSLADTVGPNMRVLVCGLNPSEYAADAGVGFARPGNRFWPAARAAGLVSVDRDPIGALLHDGVGMTDLVKRATPRADVLTATEYAEGMARLERLVSWLQPGAVLFVGLSGWRSAVDRSATAGLQDRKLADRPVYLAPSTSGANAHATLSSLTDHLRAALHHATG